jgi:hypothetical protein
MDKTAVFIRYPAVVAFGVALSLAAGPVGTAVPTAAPAVPTLAMEPAVERVHAAVDAARRHDPIPDPLRPALAGLHRDYADVGRCNYANGRHLLCRRGFADGRRVLIALGDSHARAWIPALETIAERNKYAAYYLAKPGCTAARVSPDHGTGAFVGCVEWREWAIDQIRRMRPDVLLITSALPDGIAARDGHRVTDPAELADRTRAGLMSTIRAVQSRVGHVFVVSDAPGLAEDPAVCLAQAGADLGTCASAPSAAAALHFAADRAAARATGVRFVDVRTWFCWEAVCPAVVGTTVTYRDGGHMTTVYSRSLNWPLQHAMRLVRGGLGATHDRVSRPSAWQQR